MKEQLIATNYRMPVSMLRKLAEDSRKQTAAAGKRVSRTEILLCALREHYARLEKEGACQAPKNQTPK